MVSQTPQTAEKQPNGRQGNGTPGHAKAGKVASAQPSKDGHAQRAAQDVAGLKDYQLGDCLGKGAFGSVYRALNWGTGETVAIKQVKLADLPKSELRVIMLEIDLLKNLNHPNIVKYHGFVKSAESLYIILEYCENGSLHSICKNFGKFPENLVALYMSQVLHGLLYLHEQGVIHRDIKGANILTTKEGLVKLADFGVATKTTGLNESSVVGTPYWMAPEVIELSGATTASDIWSLGCTVIELLDGKPPYHNLQPMPALFRIVNDDHPPLPEGASPAVRDFLMQCFQKDPNLRVSARKLLKHPWIVSAKRADSVVPTKTTKYDEAVKSVQQWNEALKSPNHNSLRRSSRTTSTSPVPPRKDTQPQLATPAPSRAAMNNPTTRASTEMYQSPETDKAGGIESWDDDFASSINSSELKLPHVKPHDNFAGMLSSERLKTYAKIDTVAEEPTIDDSFWDGEKTFKGPVELTQTDPLETVRPYTPGKVKAANGKMSQPNIASQRQSSQSKVHAPTNIPKAPPVPKTRLASLSRPTPLVRENSVEDYSDFIAAIDADNAAFQQKLQVMKTRKQASSSPKLYHPSDLENIPRYNQYAKKGGSLKRYPTPAEEQNESAIRRSRSSVEIQKYAEADDEDFSDIFGKDGARLAAPDSDSGSERSTLMMLNSKLLSSSWLGDDEDEDDPFAELEEPFDAMDLESNIARDRYARLCTQIEGLVGSLKISQPDDILLDLSDQLVQLLAESPELKSVIISSHGMLPILEILETCQQKDVIIRLLKIVNLIILENVEIQENLCFVGGIPIISEFAQKKYSSEIRLEAAAFVRHMYTTSTLTLQMFIGCGGLNVLVEFLEEDFETERELVVVGVNGVASVFELQGPTPKNDFCRIFSRSSVLYPLSLVLNRVLDEEDDDKEQIEGRIVNIFLLFSQAENHVKEIVADRMVLKRVLKDLGRMSPNHKITMLKFIKNLSMLPTTHEALQNSNAIDVLTDLLSSSMKLTQKMSLNHTTSPRSDESCEDDKKQRRQCREISNQILNIMYNLCRLSKDRQEEAALNGVIPLLQQIVQTEQPLKEFALPILCDMAHSGKVGRKILWQNKGLRTYISLLGDKYWQVTALDSILIWLHEETARIEQHLLDGSFSRAVADCFANPEISSDAFENLLEPLQKLLRISPPVAASLARPEIFTRTTHKLHNKKAVVRLNLLRIIRSICDATDEQGALLRTHGLYDAVHRLAEHDPAILVREMASELIRSCDSPSRRSLDGSRFRPAARRASTTMTPPPPPLISSVSMPPTPQHLRAGAGSGYFDPGYPSVFDSTSRARGGSGGSAGGVALTPGSSFRPTSRDGNSGALNGLGVSGWSGGAPAKSRLPRTSAARMGRLSLAPTAQQRGLEGKEENLVPVHMPAAGGQRDGPQQARTGSGLGPQRRRRQTSSGFEGRYT